MNEVSTVPAVEVASTKASSKESVNRRRLSAGARQAAADKRTPEEQLQRLDKLFGPGQGAGKERVKLALKIKARAKKIEKVTENGPTEAQTAANLAAPSKAQKGRVAKGSGKGNPQPE